MITMFGCPDYLKRVMDARVNGFLLKDKPMKGLIHAINPVMAITHEM